VSAEDVAQAFLHQAPEPKTADVTAVDDANIAGAMRWGRGYRNLDRVGRAAAANCYGLTQPSTPLKSA
jgi:hypothetical protein